jgi:hypothetical protein
MTRPRQFCPRGHDTFKHGRDAGHRCLECRREDADAIRALEAAAVAEREAEREAREKARLDKAEREYQRALKAGGRVAAEARWWRLSDETLDVGRFGLCQWEEEIEGKYTHVCFNRTTDVYCWRHNAQAEREAKREAKRRERELARER